MLGQQATISPSLADVSLREEAYREASCEHPTARQEARFSIEQLPLLNEKADQLLRTCASEIGEFAQGYFPEKWFTRASLVPFIRGQIRTDAETWKHLTIRDGTTKSSYAPWIDSSFGFYLTYREKPIAVASLHIPKEGYLCVVQAQGVTLHIDDENSEREYVGARGLPGPNTDNVNDVWPELLHRISYHFAAHCGFSHFGIIRSEYLPFQYPPRPRPNMHHMYEDISEYLGLNRELVVGYDVFDTCKVLPSETQVLK